MGEMQRQISAEKPDLFYKLSRQELTTWREPEERWHARRSRVNQIDVMITYDQARERRVREKGWDE